MENIPIKFPDVKIRNILSNYASLIGKTYYPGQRYEDTYYTARTRVYSCGTITDHIPKHIYQFEDTYVSAMIINHKGIHSQLIKLKKLTTKKNNFNLMKKKYKTIQPRKLNYRQTNNKKHNKNYKKYKYKQQKFNNCKQINVKMSLKQ